MVYQNDFVRNAKELRSKGRQLGQLHQIAKAGGLGVAALSGVALLSGGGALLPLAYSLVVYGSAVLSETKRTGKLQPIPFIEDDLTAIATRSITTDTPVRTLGTQPHHYLDAEDKARFYLANYQGHRLTELARSLPADQFEHICTNLIDHLVTAHEPALNHPELLSRGLGINFFDDAVAALPTAASRVVPAPSDRAALPAPSVSEPAVGAKTRLQAVDVPVEPTAEPVEPVEPVGNAIAQPTATWQPRHAQEIYIPALLTDNLRSAVVLGSPRTGKGYAVAKAIELLPPNVSLWLLDPKNDPLERHYWSRVPARQRLHFDITEIESDVADQIVTEFVSHYLQAQCDRNNPKLLIIDECSPGLAKGLSRRKFVELMGRMATICSVGPSKGKFVWILAQASTVEDLGMSNANKSTFRLVGTAHPDETQQSWFDSLTASLRLPGPSPHLLETGRYLQFDGVRWGVAQPFELSQSQKSDFQLLENNQSITNSNSEKDGGENYQTSQLELASPISHPLDEYQDSPDYSDLRIVFDLIVDNPGISRTELLNKNQVTANIKKRATRVSSLLDLLSAVDLVSGSPAGYYPAE